MIQIRKLSYLRSPIKYFGGKGQMIKKILDCFPNDIKIYCEAFCGGASIFFAKKPSPVEVINDLNKYVINLYMVLRDDNLYKELENKVYWTLYSKMELEIAIKYLQDIRDNFTIPDVKVAHAFYVIQNQIMSGVNNIDLLKSTSWSRSFKNNKNNMNFVNEGENLSIAKSVSAWLSRKELFDDWHKRLSLAQIDSRDALEFIEYWDTPDTFFYLDPPYIPDTRKSLKVYEHEQDLEFHKKLVNVLLNIKGRVALSGYEHEVYKPLENNGWKIIKWDLACTAAGRTRNSGLQGEGSGKNCMRTECLYVNYDVNNNNKISNNNGKNNNYSLKAEIKQGVLFE